MKTAPTLTGVLCAFVFSTTLLILNGCATALDHTLSKGNDDSLPLDAKPLDDSLYVFDFIRGKTMSAEQKAKQWSEMGYKGVAVGLRKPHDIPRIKAYLATPEVKSGKFSISVVLLPMKVSADGIWDDIWKQSLVLTPTTDLWPIIHNNRKLTKKQVVSVLKEMCIEAAKVGTDVVIYPHDGTFIESVEEAIPYVKEVAMPNLYLTMHLAHELRAGNGDRLLEVATKAAPYLKHASISGANKNINLRAGKDWSGVIKPLDEGEFPLEEFIDALEKINFNSKMFLHTFGIKQPINQHLPRSYKKWKELVKP